MPSGVELAGLGAAGIVGYELLKRGQGVDLAAPVPAGTTIVVTVSGFDTLATLFSPNAYGNPLQSRFEGQIGQAGYTILAWNVISTPLTSAALDNQVPYSGSFTIQTTTSFAQGLDIQNSIIGNLYAVTGYEPVANVSGGSAGTPGTALNLSGLGNFLSGLSGSLGTVTILLALGLAVLIWSERKALVRAIP